MTMIKKIKRIDNFGSFSEFDWDSSVRDEDDNEVDFKKTNILYGRNYSGKTTLSRIFRALEKGTILEGYKDGKFTLVADNGDEIENKPEELASSPGIVRVFNRDFVKENLSFLHDDEGEIKPFVVLGKANVEAQLEIDELEKELGASDDVPGLRKDAKDAKAKWKSAREECGQSEEKLETQLRKKAVAIKNTPNREMPDYTIKKIRDDIKNIRGRSCALLDQQKIDEFNNALDEPGKAEIQSPAKLSLQLADLAQDAKELVERKISFERPVNEMASTPGFRKWVQEGLKLHREENRDKCGFCGRCLPNDLLAKLESYFNDEVKNLTTSIDTLLEKVEGEKTTVLQYADEDAFEADRYVALVKDKQRNALNQFKIEAQKYADDLETLGEQLKLRKDDILNRKEFDGNVAGFSNLVDAEDMLHNAIQKTNEIASNLSEKKKEAREGLRLQVVQKFMEDIDYESQTAEIARRDSLSSDAKTDYETILDKVEQLTDKIDSLKAKLGNEKTGAETVNTFLRFCFGHALLSLHAVKEGDGSQDKYQFVIRRNDDDAYNLSDGERNLIAFCYFIASLSDSTIDAPSDNLIVWIDDPVSSLDANHIFNIYSLIRSGIVKSGGYAQLFVATHNLDLLKYLSNDDRHNKKYAYFHIERKTKASTIVVMSKYLRESATEFNHMFAQIRECAEADGINAENRYSFDTFGNNARRFLELFLCYLYPSETNHNERMHKFFGGKDSPSEIRVAKMIDELSHLQGSLERGARPRDVNHEEIQKVAKDILCRIKKHNSTQFCELMKSTTNNNAQN